MKGRDLGYRNGCDLFPDVQINGQVVISADMFAIFFEFSGFSLDDRFGVFGVVGAVETMSAGSGGGSGKTRDFASDAALTRLDRIRRYRHDAATAQEVNFSPVRTPSLAT